MREVQNGATRTACQAQVFIDEEEHCLEEEEANVAANMAANQAIAAAKLAADNAIFAAKAQTEGVRVGRELNRKLMRFSVSRWHRLKTRMPMT
jgi:hypothetical protein